MTERLADEHYVVTIAPVVQSEAHCTCGWNVVYANDDQATSAALHHERVMHPENLRGEADA